MKPTGKVPIANEEFTQSSMKGSKSSKTPMSKQVGTESREQEVTGEPKMTDLSSSTVKTEKVNEKNVRMYVCMYVCLHACMYVYQ